MTKKKGRRTTVPGIHALGKGKYRVRVRITDRQTGRTIERDRIVVADSIRSAVKLKQRLAEELVGKREEEVEKQRRTLGDFATSWLRGQWSSLLPSTRDKYTTLLDRHILPDLGHLFVDGITVEGVETWRDRKKSEGYAAATVNGLLALLRTILGRAARVERLPFNPALEVKALPLDDVRTTNDEPNALTPVELERFLVVARERQPQHYAMILTLLTTGMRLSNARALRWEDIDEAAEVIHVRRRISADRVVPGVKRSRSARDVVPLLSGLANVFAWHRARLSEVQRESGWVFPTKAGAPRAKTVLRKPFKDILKHAKIAKRFTPHGCRRTANDLYRQTTSEVVTRSITGHLTHRMHAHYSTVSAEEKVKAATAAFADLVPEEGTAATASNGVSDGDSGRGPEEGAALAASDGVSDDSGRRSEEGSASTASDGVSDGNSESRPAAPAPMHAIEPKRGMNGGSSDEPAPTGRSPK